MADAKHDAAAALRNRRKVKAHAQSTELLARTETALDSMRGNMARLEAWMKRYDTWCKAHKDEPLCAAPTNRERVAMKDAVAAMGEVRGAAGVCQVELMALQRAATQMTPGVTTRLSSAAAAAVRASVAAETTARATLADAQREVARLRAALAAAGGDADAHTRTLARTKDKFDAHEGAAAAAVTPKFDAARVARFTKGLLAEA